MKHLKSLKEKIHEILKILFWEINYQAFEVFNGLMMFILGASFFFLISGQETLERTIASYPFQYVVYIIASFMVAFGGLKVYAITRQNIVLRKWLALVGSFMWGFLFVIFANPPIKPTSVVFIAVLTAFSMWTYIRLVLEHKGKRLLDPRDSFTNE